MQVIASNLLTNYTATGEGGCILLLHGWGDDQNTFSRLTQALKDSYKIITLDLPGFGKTQSPAETWGLDDYAKFIGDFMHKLNLEPYAIIGHSNGGAIAIRGLARGSLRAEKLVLLASAGIRDEYKGRKRMLRIAAKAAKAATAPLPGKLQRRLKARAYSTIGSDMFVAEHLQDTFKRIVTDDVSQDAAIITQKTLLIYGDQDEATPIRFGEKFNSLIIDSRLEIVKSAGHFIHRDQPERIHELVREFLKS
jgi:pimeloyl-ACP methyl ester carboxylesterase